MLRVVIINDASIARGGATGLAMLQAKMLHERGIEVVFATGDSGSDDLFPDHDIDTRHAGGTALMKSNPLVAATRGFYSKASHAMLRAMIANEDTPETVYHIHSFTKSLTPSIYAALQPVAQRCFVHGHDFFLACPNGGFMDYQRGSPCQRTPLSASCLTTHCDKRNYAQKLWRVGRQMTLHHTMPRDRPWGGILMIHPAMRPYYEKSGYPSQMLHTVRNPAESLSTTRIPAEANSRFFFIGRVEAEKGIEDLITAAKRAQVPLSVIGTGPLLDTLRAQNPDVAFHGWLDRKAIGAAIASARALVMPSRYPEPFGLVAAEASLSGLPVILSQSALLGPEMAEKGVGFTCDPRKIDGFATVLRKMADMPADQVKAMSLLAASGTANLCSAPQDWIDAQISHYNKAISAA